jgi:flagellar basal-body rod protein FlgB
MFETLDITRMAQALAAHSGARLGVIAANVANADTPGYRAGDLPDFSSVYGDAEPLMRTTRPGHLGGADPSALDVVRTVPGADAPNGNSVSLESEMVKAVEVRQQHDMALAVYKSVADILRTSLGRGR